MPEVEDVEGISVGAMGWYESFVEVAEASVVSGVARRVLDITNGQGMERAVRDRPIWQVKDDRFEKYCPRARACSFFFSPCSQLHCECRIARMAWRTRVSGTACAVRRCSPKLVVMRED